MVGENKDRIKCRSPYKQYEYKYLECWLNEMAGDGWVLEAVGTLFFTFKRSSRHYGKYTVVPVPKQKDIDKEKEAWRDAGWEYIDASVGNMIFYTEDPRARYLHYDVDVIKRHKKKCIRAAASSAIAILISVATFMYSTFSSKGPEPGILHQVNDDPLLYMFIGIVILLAVLWLLLAVTDLIVVMARPAAEGKIVSSNYRRKKIKENIILSVLCLVFTISIILLISIDHVDFDFKQNQNTGDISHPVMLSEIDNEAAAEAKGKVRYVTDEYDEQREDRGYRLDSQKTIIFNVFNEEDAFLRAADMSYYAWYGEAKSEKLAEMYIAEEMDYYRECREYFNSETADIKKIDMDGVSEIWFAEDEDEQHLWLRKGSRIESVEFDVSEKNLKDYVETYVDDICENME